MRVIAKPTPGGGAILPALVAGGAITTVQIFARTDDVTKPIVLEIPGAGKQALAGKTLIVRASGRITTATATNVTATLQSGTSLTSGSNTTIKASTARGCNTASSNWFLEGHLIYDATSGLLNGTACFCVNNLYDVHAAVTQITGLTSLTLDALASLVCGITFSAGDVGNKAWLDEFVLGM